MTPAELLGKIHLGDAYALMERWPESFVDCTVTSVPCWQQQEYLPEGHKLKAFEIGAENTVQKYLDGMRDVFSQVHRITKPTGVLWLNVGDKIAGPRTKALAPEYHEGELMGLPWLLAAELRKVGWRRVAEIIWDKPNQNPEATTRRPTISHEHVFLFAKSDEHFFDPWAIMEPSVGPGQRFGKLTKRGPRRPDCDQQGQGVVGPARRARSVWRIPTVSLNGRKLLADFREDGEYRERDPDCQVHGDNPVVSAGALFDLVCPPAACSCSPVDTDFFAAMPPKLAARCLLAGTSEAGCCAACGAPYKRLVKKERVPTRAGIDCKVDSSCKARRDPLRHVTHVETIGWERTCEHADAGKIPAVVFDPFTGSGTTLLVADVLGRSWLGTELNPVCAKKLAPARIAKGLLRSALCE